MTTKFVRPGDTFEHTASATFTKDLVDVVDSVAGVSQNSGVSGDVQVLALKGVYTLPCDAGFAPAKGAKVFWDNTAKTCKATGIGFFKIGVADKVKVGSTLDVLLNGIDVTAV